MKLPSPRRHCSVVEWGRAKVRPLQDPDGQATVMATTRRRLRGKHGNVSLSFAAAPLF